MACEHFPQVTIDNCPLCFPETDYEIKQQTWKNEPIVEVFRGARGSKGGARGSGLLSCHCYIYIGLLRGRFPISYSYNHSTLPIRRLSSIKRNVAIGLAV